MPRILHLGSMGDDVKYLQEQLAAQPSQQPPLAADGIFGPLTQARVSEYQTGNGLWPDGIVGPLTWSSLLGRSVAETLGFCVLGRDLYARDGARVILRGVNKMSVWDNDDPDGAVSFPEIKQTGANSVRIVWAITTNLQPGGPATTTAALDALISNAKASHLIPMVELHDATGDWSRLSELVDYWTQPAVVSIIRKHQAYLLINIGNEVGVDTVSRADFVAGYSSAVRRMRAAGIHVPLVIDASDWGKDLGMLNATAADLSAADPEGNLMFSVHLYWAMSCGADAAFIRSNLQQAVDAHYPLLVGEFSQYGGYPCANPGASICGPEAEIDYKTILSACHDYGLGWYAWEWGPGNGYNDPLCDVMDMTRDRKYANLKPGWASEVAASSPYGIQKTSVTPAWV